MKKLFIVLFLFVALVPLISFAEIPPGEGLQKITTIVCRAMNLLFTLAIIVSVIFVLVAAFNYITSQGNSEKVETATKSILYVMIGIVVAILARSVPAIIASFIDAGSASTKVCVVSSIQLS